jgi:osmotically-inducible protein OsmY
VTSAPRIAGGGFHSLVQLSGFVSSQANINKAVEVARSVPGV